MLTPEKLEALRDRATRPRRTVPIVTDGTLRERIQAAEGDEELLDALYEEAAEDTVLLVVEGLRGTEWRALCAQFPPQPGKPGIYDAFLDAEAAEETLIRSTVIGQAASLESAEVEPLPDGTLDWLLEWATVEQRLTLFVAAFACSRGTDAVPLRPARSETPNSAGA